MKKNKKVLVIIASIVVLLIIGIVLFIVLQKPTEVKITMENETTDQKVMLKDIEFSNITKKYEEGITTIQASIQNNTNTMKNLKIKIILKDETGKEIGNMIQKIDNIEPKKEKILTTGIAGDYSTIKDIEFKVID